jgi:hypothetical protein
VKLTEVIGVVDDDEERFLSALSMKISSMQSPDPRSGVPE